MLQDTIRDIVTKAVAALQEHGAIAGVEAPAFEIMRPQLPARGEDASSVSERLGAALAHGDYSTNVALKLAAALRAAGHQIAPRALAETIAAEIRETVGVVPAYDLVSAVEVAGPGFINLRLDDRWLLRQTAAILAAGDQLGNVDVGRGRRVNLEFVSANPTGPVTVANGRGAFLGDALGNVLRAAGYDVTKEYYFNDAGAQLDQLGFSMERYCRFILGEAVSCRIDDIEGEAAPEVVKPSERFRKGKGGQAAGTAEAATPKPRKPRGYYDPYYESVAERLLARDGRGVLDRPDAERLQALGKAAADIIMGDIQTTMRRMKVEFDVWFNQASLEPSGAIQAGIQAVRDGGFLEERDGAVWMKSSQFGDDQDRVIIKSSGEPTYITSDIAYMRDKFERGFDQLIFVLGPDHHGYIGRLKATAAMLGHDPERVHVLIYGNVALKVGGRTMRMGKRLGNAVTLDDLDEEIGADVTRFFYLMLANETPLAFDLELARKQTSDNPGLSVQYAHARACGVFRKAEERGIAPEQYAEADPLALAGDAPDELAAELNLLRALLRLEEVVERAAATFEPHVLTAYGMELAEAYHLFYDTCPILKAGSEVPREVQLARLRLMAAARAGLARTLHLLGMEAPERMEREGAEVAAGTLGAVE